MRGRAQIIRATATGSAPRPMRGATPAWRILGMTPPLVTPAIETRGLGKAFGARAAPEHVDLVVPRGVAFGFLGANGAGKTTLIRLLLGLAEPTTGTMRVLGHAVPDARA